MSNKVRVSAPFSFRGETHHPEMELDLDRFLAEGRSLDDLYPMLAAANGIGAYSYEYEVLESSAKIFSEPTGIAAEFINDEGFDLEGFKTKHSEKGILEKLQSIASETLNIDNLAESEKIQNALMQAYQAGFKDKA